MSKTSDPYAVPAGGEDVASRADTPAEPQRPAFTHMHLAVFAILLLGATVQTYLVTSNGLSGSSSTSRRVVVTTLLAITGPLTGAISRDLQTCCLRFSVMLLPYCLPPLLAAFGLQVLWRPRSRSREFVRVTIWALGWIGWFFAGLFSFVHALN